MSRCCWSTGPRRVREFGLFKLVAGSATVPFGRMRGEESSDSESGRMEESSVRRSLETLCQELNMDEQTATEAMENFTAIWKTYTLEVRRVLWP